MTTVRVAHRCSLEGDVPYLPALGSLWVVGMRTARGSPEGDQSQGQPFSMCKYWIFQVSKLNISPLVCRRISTTLVNQYWCMLHYSVIGKLGNKQNKTGAHSVCFSVFLFFIFLYKFGLLVMLLYVWLWVLISFGLSFSNKIWKSVLICECM